MDFVLTSENYHSLEANWLYLGSSQYKNFCGSLGMPGCESRALAMLRGDWEMEITIPLLVGSYVDAHFEGTLDVFKAQHPNLFSVGGRLKKPYEKAEEVIQRIERDPFFMECMAGQKQTIMTAELFGAMWKIKIDSYHPGKVMVDLKVMKSIREGFWVKDYGKMSFVEYWGYDIQAAIYQEVIRIVTGIQIPCLIAAASKERVTDIEVIGFYQDNLATQLEEIKNNTPRIVQLKKGEVEPSSCGVCDYCKHNKFLTNPIHYSQLLERV